MESWDSTRSALAPLRHSLGVPEPHPMPSIHSENLVTVP